MDQPFYSFSILDNAHRFEFVSKGRRSIKKSVIYFATTIPDLYSLTLADVREDNSLDVYITSDNGDMPKILATVFQTISSFLISHPNAIVGFKGSTASRTRLYQIAITHELDRTQDPALMAGLGETTLAETSLRLAEGHRAYVASRPGVPAAFGWVATRQARIGELNHAFTLPVGHRYLWNFRTRPAYRGRGLYPRLLGFIAGAQRTEATQLWIMHAPENDSSERGILRAGFRLVGKVSVLYGYEVIFTPQSGVAPLEEVLQTFGFKKSEETPASCWNCSSPYLKNRQPGCCCSKRDRECTRNEFQLG